MNTAISRQQFLEKTVTDSFGRQYRVVFAFSFVDGEVRGRVISAELISETLTLKGRVNEFKASGLCLPCARATLTPYSVLLTPRRSFVSPYFSVFELLITSQPTRAPSRF